MNQVVLTTNFVFQHNPTGAKEWTFKFQNNSSNQTKNCCDEIIVKRLLGSKRDSDIKNRLLDPVEEGEGRMIWKNSIEKYTLPYVK